MSLIGEDTCPICGEKYTYEFDPRTGEYRRLTMCGCEIKLKELEKKVKSLNAKRAHAIQHIEKAIKIIEEWNRGGLDSIGKAFEHLNKALRILKSK